MAILAGNVQKRSYRHYLLGHLLLPLLLPLPRPVAVFRIELLMVPMSKMLPRTHNIVSGGSDWSIEEQQLPEVHHWPWPWKLGKDLLHAQRRDLLLTAVFGRRVQQQQQQQQRQRRQQQQQHHRRPLLLLRQQPRRKQQHLKHRCPHDDGPAQPSLAPL